MNLTREGVNCYYPRSPNHPEPARRRVEITFEPFRLNEHRERLGLVPEEALEIPSYFVQLPDTFCEYMPELDSAFVGSEAYLSILWGFGYRCVSLDRLPTILSTGIDVTPSDSIIFVSDLDKASEYGGWPKVALGLDYQHLKRITREVSKDMEPDEFAELQRSYPYIEETRDSTIVLSRLDPSDPHSQRSYKDAYGHWIPGNAFEALRRVVIFFREKGPPGSRPYNGWF